MKNSTFLSLNWLDLGKAFLLAFIAFLLNYLQVTFIPSLNFLTPEVKVIAVSFIGYLIKNFFQGKPTNTIE